MSLVLLPVENQLQILSYLPDHRDVAALSLQSQRLHFISEMNERKRFSHITISDRQGDVDNALNLLMEILNRPTLGDYVRHIRYCGGFYSIFKFANFSHTYDPSSVEARLLRTRLGKAGFEGDEGEHLVKTLMAARSYGYQSRWGSESLGAPQFSVRTSFLMQALAVAFIAVSPNLASLALDPPIHTGWQNRAELDNNPGFPLDTFLRRANENPAGQQYLQNLREVYVINPSINTQIGSKCHTVHLPGHLPTYFRMLSLFDQLPSIEFVEVDNLQRDLTERAQLERKASRISRIRMLNSSLDTLDIAQLVSSCDALREFRYSTGGNVTKVGSSYCFNPKVFIKAISGQKGTLETLDLDVEAEMTCCHGKHICGGTQDDADRFDEDLEQHGGPLSWQLREGDFAFEQDFLGSFWEREGSLGDFLALRSLSIGIGLLLYFARGTGSDRSTDGDKIMLAECLPDNLESLCIRGYVRGDNEEYDEQVDALRSHFQSGSSGLKEIRGIDEMIPHSDAHRSCGEECKTTRTIG